MPRVAVLVVLALAVVLSSPAPAAAAPPAYCTGQRITDDFDVLHYPNGQRVVDGFGKESYPNGVRLTNDYGDEIRYATGTRVRNSSGEVLFPNGTPVKTASGEVRYPNGARTRDSSGRCYFETGTEMTPCRRDVAIRDRLPGGETAFYQLDLVTGAIELGAVRYEFPAGRIIHEPSGTRPCAGVASRGGAWRATLMASRGRRCERRLWRARRRGLYWPPTEPPSRGMGGPREPQPERAYGDRRAIRGAPGPPRLATPAQPPPAVSYVEDAGIAASLAAVARARDGRGSRPAR